MTIPCWSPSPAPRTLWHGLKHGPKWPRQPSPKGFARLSYLEAAGWLRTGSYAAASVGDRLQGALPSTAAQEGGFETPPSDILFNDALQLARLWRRIAELSSWRPLADADRLREALRALGCRTLDDAEIADWLASIRTFDRGPVLIRAGRTARDWINRAGVEPHNPAGFFVAACLWREKTAHAPIPSPSGRRRSSIITGLICASVSTGWRNFSNA
jgi:hypothetical protein